MFGVWLFAVSLLMIFRPQLALYYLSKMASTNLINYTELSLRMIVGFVFWFSAASSKFPEVFEVAGVFLMITAVILMLIPRRWHAAYAVWWSKKLTPAMLKMSAPFSIAAGVFVIYAVL
ncbi:MAG: hypothetical protein DHS20C05_02020 [Hyphococcus sp.]|nr:MAG: hypothetical protein DHS20C05_02020 [Marinicaulis sp.]